MSSEEEWEDAVTEDGELLYVEPAETQPVSPAVAHSKEDLQTAVHGVLPTVTKPFMDKQGDESCSVILETIIYFFC